MRSRPWKEFPTIRDRLADARLNATTRTLSDHLSGHRRMAAWDSATRRLYTEVDSLHRTPPARRWRMLIRIKRRLGRVPARL